MHAITLLTVGKVKISWIDEGTAFYLKRLAPLTAIDHVILRAGTPEEESSRMLEALAKRDAMKIILDERGKTYTSVDFSKMVETQRDHGRPLLFAIGGAYGFSDDVKKQADLLLSLSPMTLPHELAFLFFAEQLYRAHAIMAGSGYHH